MDMDIELREVSGGRESMLCSWIGCDAGVSSELWSSDTGVGAIDKGGVECMSPDESVLWRTKVCEVIF